MSTSSHGVAFTPPPPPPWIATVRKAVLSGACTGVGVLGGLMADGNVTGPDVIIAVGAAMTAATVTWAVPNAE